MEEIAKEDGGSGREPFIVLVLVLSKGKSKLIGRLKCREADKRPVPPVFVIGRALDIKY